MIPFISDLSGRLRRMATDVVPAVVASQLVAAQVAWWPIPAMVNPRSES
jgi:hypothetical protein